VEKRIEPRRTRGVSATEYIVVAVLVGLSGVGIWSRLGPSAKCRMQAALQSFGDSGGKAISCDDSGGGGDGAGGAAATPSPFAPPTAGGKGGSGSGGSGQDSPPKVDDESCPGGVCTVPGNCFVAGTPVLSQDGPVPIERVTVGMRVLSRDQNGDAIEWKPVVHTFAHQTDELVALTIGSAAAPETLEVTPTHLVYAKGRGWVGVDALTPGGDTLIDAQGRDLAVLSAVSFAAEVTVYNFEVEDFHTYYVGEHSLWAHNTCPHDKSYACYFCGESESGNLTGPPSYPAYPTTTYYAAPSYDPPTIVYAAPGHTATTYVPPPKPAGGGGGYSGGGGGATGASSGSGKDGKLTSDEKAAVKQYTIGSNYVNKPLRNGEQLPKKDWQDVKNIDSALKKLPKTYGTFYRGISANTRILHKKNITDLGYMSFTDDKKVASSFFNSPLKPMKPGDKPTLLVYEGKLPGIQQFAIEKYQWEKEFLMGRGADLKVLDAYTDKNGVQIIKLGKDKSGKKDGKKKDSKKDKPKEIQVGYVKKGMLVKHDGKEWKAPANGQYYINTKGQLVLEK
jgi:hypothetical protein